MRRYHHISFQHAFDGLAATFKNQPNLRVHFIVTVLVLGASLYFKVTRIEWLILLFTIMWVLVSEMINSVVEAICDLLVSEYNREVKYAKDVASGMVLIGAMGAVVVGLVIFLPYLFKL